MGLTRRQILQYIPFTVTSFLPEESIKPYERATSINGRYLSQSRGNRFLLTGGIMIWKSFFYTVDHHDALSFRRRIKYTAIIWNSIGTKDLTTGIFIFFHAYLAVRKYFRRVYKHDVSECGRQWHTAFPFAYIRGVSKMTHFFLPAYI